MNDGNDNGLYPPSVMINNEIYLLSGKSSESYNLSDSKSIKEIGSITNAISGSQLAKENFQVTGFTDLIICKIFTSVNYPNHLFILNEEGNYIAFIKDVTNVFTGCEFVFLKICSFLI